MPHLIIEYDFKAPVSEEDMERMSKSLSACIDIRKLRRVRTVISADRRRGFCEFEGPDAETLREAFRMARIPFRSVWEADWFETPPPPQER